MYDIEPIKHYLKKKKRSYISDVRLRTSDDVILLYVPQQKLADNAKGKFTSVRQLSNVKKDLLKEFGKIAEVLFVQSEDQEELEAGFFRMLNRRFNQKIASLYISLRNENVVDAWIEVEGLGSQAMNGIEKHFAVLLGEAELVLGKINWLESPVDLPSLPQLLRIVKVYQPVNVDDLLEVVARKFNSVSKQWLARKLDQLRKKGMIIREADGSYALCSAALSLIPAGARRNSSDIDRALALGKRKW